ncbi:MAG TPA: metal-dependent transcriptional regulator [Ignavibacteriaceae bacterium]|nr:metal-dependent transcriptional regulator [Ignavibacteriaceae bacterium]
MKNISKEDYLSVIYKNSDDNKEIKANLIAEKLLISNAAVTDMLRKLSKEALIDYKPYKSIKLTESGENYAKNMVRRHRIWELFLHQVVGLPWDKVHDEAEKLEHSGSDELINRMEEMLNFPEFDPHGDPIPSKDGAIPKQRTTVSLSTLVENDSGVVIRVNDFNKSFLIYLAQIGIELNSVIEVKEKRSFDNSMLISVSQKEWNISETLAENVFVEKLKA